MASDVRAIANFILELAETRNIGLTNMAVNKIVYFAYEDYLLETGKKLTSAKIEAWNHGPVFRELYSAFKKYNDDPITEKAVKIDPNTGIKQECELDIDSSARKFLEEKVQPLLVKSASTLRNLSHLPNGPWDRVWNHGGDVNIGMQITDEIILDCAKNGWRQ